MQSREQFDVEAKPLTVTINGSTFTLEPRRFSTGSVGWNLNGKVEVQGVKCQIGLNVTVIGSKSWES